MNRRPQPKGWSIRSHQPQADAADVVWRIENTCVVERFPEWSCRWRQEGLNGEQEPPHHCFKTPPKILTAAICNPKKVMKCSKSGRSSESSTSILGFQPFIFQGVCLLKPNTQPASANKHHVVPRCWPAKASGWTTTSALRIKTRLDSYPCISVNLPIESYSNEASPHIDPPHVFSLQSTVKNAITKKLDLAKDGSAKGRSWCHAEKGGVTQPRGGGWWEKVWIPPVFWFVNPFLQKSVLLKKMWNRKIWYQSETFRWGGPNIWPSYHLSHGKLYKMAFPSFPLCRSCTHPKNHWRWLASKLELYFLTICLNKSTNLYHWKAPCEIIPCDSCVLPEWLVVLAHYNKLTDGMLRVASKKQHANVVWQIPALTWHFFMPSR